jgi:hypothetical protein
MPNIRQFNDPIQGLRPDDKGAQATVMAARHVEGVYQQAGEAIGGGIAALGDEYVKQKSFQDISHGLATSPEMQTGLTSQWNQVAKTTDPNDHSVAEKFLNETVEPALTQWESGFTTEQGRTWATEHAAQIRQHFSEKTAADQSTLAGAAAVDNYKRMVTGLSNGALQDPTNVNTALGSLDAGIAALIAHNPNATPELASKMATELRDEGRKEIFKGGFIGMARGNPDQAIDALVKGYGSTDLDATEREQLYGFAASQKRQMVSDQRAQTEMQKQANEQDFKVKMSALTGQMFAADGSLVIPPNFHQNLLALSLHPGADPAAIRAAGDAGVHAIELANTRALQPTNPATWRDLTSRIGAQDGTPGSLTHAMVDRQFADGNLSATDYHFLHQAVETAKADPAAHAAIAELNQALTRVKPLVDHSNLYSGKLDQSGTALFDDLHFDTFQRLQQLEKGGMSAQDAVKVLTDPRDPRGIQANLTPYQTNNKQGLAAIHARVSAAGGPTSVTAPALTTARKPGESAADYLKRTGG